MDNTANAVLGVIVEQDMDLDKVREVVHPTVGSISLGRLVKPCTI